MFFHHAENFIYQSLHAPLYHNEGMDILDRCVSKDKSLKCTFTNKCSNHVIGMKRKTLVHAHQSQEIRCSGCSNHSIPEFVCFLSLA
jgi:hypothetical protein